MLSCNTTPLLLCKTTQKNNWTHPFKDVLLFCLLLSEVISLKVEIFVGVHGNVINTFHQLAHILFQHWTVQRIQIQEYYFHSSFKKEQWLHIMQPYTLANTGYQSAKLKDYIRHKWCRGEGGLRVLLISNISYSVFQETNSFHIQLDLLSIHFWECPLK